MNRLWSKKALKWAYVSLAVGVYGVCSPASVWAACQHPAPTNITISPDIPCELEDVNDLGSAAVFAWNEFIALTWPALAQGPTSFPRGKPKTDGDFGNAQSYGKHGPTGQVVWETYRHRIETFPGQGEPNGYNASATDFGFSAKPAYGYRGGFNGIPASGVVPPYTGITNPDVPPFHNLDEVTQIALNAMYAGIVDPNSMLGESLKTDVVEKILYEAKVNEVVYSYSVRPRGTAANEFAFYEDGNSTVFTIKNNSRMFLRTGDAAQFPPPYINLPSSNPEAGLEGSIEIKAAWRRINPSREDPSKFYTAPVRYYVGKFEEEPTSVDVEGFVDSDQIGEVWGLVALHIIHKTPNAPSFIYATFGHIDNILAADGSPVEEPDGKTKLQFENQPAFLPDLKILDSLPVGTQQRAIKGAGTANTNLPQLYYHNLFNKAVIEDPATSKDLFTASADFGATLSKGFIPDAIRTQFSDLGITTIAANPTNKSRKPPVETLNPDSAWRILDTENKNLTYHIELEGGALHVFEIELYEGPVAVNRRLYPIPPTIIAANQAAHQAIRQANATSVWQNYRLVNVQARPLNRDSIPPGEEATYFLANEIVETNTSLQQFSGSVQGSFAGRITDFLFNKTEAGQATYSPVNNMFVVKNGVPVGFNMGGCMGCHGGQGQISQFGGGDFSVLLARGRITRPDIIQEDEEQDEELMRANSQKYFGPAPVQ